MHAVDPANYRRRRIVLTTFGSLGDLHPYIAVALGLRERGHEAIIATSGSYRQKVRRWASGFGPCVLTIPTQKPTLT
jgi:UDP:flavonoid glycosyltransferase YjiC (YdhE family)